MQGVAYDLGLPDGQLAHLRYSTSALVALERECGEVPLLRQIASGQMVRPTVLLLWAARLHQEPWTVERAALALDRHLQRSGGGPAPVRPARGAPREARAAWREAHQAWRARCDRGMQSLQRALGDAMVDAGAWRINILDPEALADDAEAYAAAGAADGPPADVEGVELLGGDGGGGDPEDPPAPAAETPPGGSG